MNEQTIALEDSWKSALSTEFEQPYMQRLKSFLIERKQMGKRIFPKGSEYFRALDLTPLDDVKVVILGQDPYHGPKQAHGLCFSVQNEVPPPPSLINIFKELKSDLGLTPPNNGNLIKWAEHGVLLLNAILTVRASEPTSHSKIGWETFTDAVIRKISEKKQNVVFLLWGRFAQDKQILIDATRHHVLKAAHPSPFSADKGFFGCRHFSKANELLAKAGIEPVDWSLS